MSAFDDATATADGYNKPPRVVRLPVSAFAASWEMKPEVECSVGIRLPSQDDAETVESEAMKALQGAISSGDDAAILAYNQSRLVNLVALCVCSPDDVTQPHELFPAPNATLPLALTPAALRRLFDEIERLQIDTSPIFAEANEDEIAAVVELLIAKRLDAMRETDPINSARCRRYLAFCLELMN